MDLLEKPLYELEKAKLHLAEMHSAKSLMEFEEAWKSYLSRLERVWNKFMAAYKGHRKWDGWGGQYIRTKKSDQLLSYLTNARGADEHSISEITEKSEGFTAIDPVAGNPWYIKNLTIERDVITRYEGSQPIKVTFSPAKIKLIPIVNRGVEFPVPTLHLGNPVNPGDIILIAELGIAYYSKILEDSKGVFI